MKAALGRGLETTLFLLGVVLALVAPLYIGTALLHKAGLPTPAQAAGADGNG